MKVLFYLISSRGTKRYEILNIAERTLKKKSAMSDFLKSWAEKSSCWDSSENHITYGYEAASKVKRFILYSKRADRYTKKAQPVSRFVSKTEGIKQMRKKDRLEAWFQERGTRMFPTKYELVEVK